MQVSLGRAANPEELHGLFVEAFNSGVMERILALYEPGAVLVAEPGKPVSGRNAIREAFRIFLAGNPRITLETRNVYQMEDGVALMHGRWYTVSADGQMSGRNTEVARRQPDGTWLFAIDNPFTPE